MQQNLAQLLLLQLAACLLKAFFTLCKWKRMKSRANIFNLSWNHTPDWIYSCRFCNLIDCKKKVKSFFKKIILCHGKVLSTQTSDFAIGLSIYIGICRMPTRIARVENQSIWIVNQLRGFYIIWTLALTHFSPVLHSYRNQLFDLLGTGLKS